MAAEARLTRHIDNRDAVIVSQPRYKIEPSRKGEGMANRSVGTIALGVFLGLLGVLIVIGVLAALFLFSW